MRLVIVESPFAGKTRGEEERNVRYARACLHDCLMRGEAPYASHLLYTQPGVLRDDVPEERRLGIEAGLCWGRQAEVMIVFTDLGVTPGMEKGIARAESEGRVVTYRKVEGWDPEQERIVEKHRSSNPYMWGHGNAVQDDCENCQFASAGGMDKRTAMEAPEYVPEDQAEEFLRGYRDCCESMYGEGWETAKWGWRPALTIGSEEDS